eukprot:c12732_g1_i3.p2 GENE.c12732_g1_i3~~c12732_g1_i3.p2  ORF type:complete len:151 (-),score=31.82 c12732_g1_i3:1389-1841(-)
MSKFIVQNAQNCLKFKHSIPKTPTNKKQKTTSTMSNQDTWTQPSLGQLAKIPKTKHNPSTHENQSQLQIQINEEQATAPEFLKKSPINAFLCLTKRIEPAPHTLPKIQQHLFGQQSPEQRFFVPILQHVACAKRRMKVIFLGCLRYHIIM